MGSYRNILNHLHLKIYFPLSGYFRLVLAIIKSQEILEIVKKWQQTVPRKGKVYRILNTEIKKKCRKAKEEWLNENSTKIERMSKTKSASMYNCIKEWTGRKIERKCWSNTSSIFSTMRKRNVQRLKIRMGQKY